VGVRIPGTSISRLLSVGVIGSLLLAGIVIAQTANWLLDSTLRDYMGTDLRDESRSILRAIKRGPNGLLLDSKSIDPEYDRPLSGRYFVVTINQRQWRSRSLWDEQLAPANSEELSDELVDGPNNQRLLWLGANYRRFGEPIEVLVAVDYSPILQDIRDIRYVLLASGILVLVLLALLQHYLVRRSLRPLEVARQQVEQLRNGSITSLTDQVPEELAPLVHEINRLLHDTQQQLHRSRTALADLSHALKTPLAVLLNLAERDAIRREPPLRDAITAQIEQMRQRITREMAHARTAGTHRAENFFDIDTDLPLLLESLRRVHRHRVAITSQIDLQGRIPWEREDVLELLGNLLDNACKWGREDVILTMQRVNGTLLIQVADDGPGIPEGELHRAMQRGERLDESVVGHGLGLAIVADKVEAYQGTLRFDRNEAGGLTARIELPWH
jgi:signal transduction histidine kinase